MTLTAVPAALPIPIASPVFDAPDPDFQRRWREWKARGRAHEQATRRRALLCTMVAAPLALAALVTIVLFGS
jgi:hypothetical protein